MVNQSKVMVLFIIKALFVLFGEVSSDSISGCSKDSANAIIKAIESKFSLDLFNRTRLLYKVTPKHIERLKLTELGRALEEGQVAKDTIFFDNLVETKSDFESRWESSLESTWILKLV